MRQKFMPGINLQIVKAGISDIEKLQSVSRTTFQETFKHLNSAADLQQYLENNLGLERLTDELSNQDSEFYFATQKNELLGYLKINFGSAQTEYHQGSSLEIERIYVLKEYHGSGIGQLLLDWTIGVAKNRMLGAVWLGVWEKNARAIRFYEKNGFKIYGQHIFVLGSDQQTDLLMRLVL